MPVTISGGTIVDAPANQTLKFGSQIVSWSIQGPLIAEEFEMEYGMRELDTMDEVGKPNKAAYIPTKGKGTSVLQIKTSVSAAPTLGETASFVPYGGGSPIIFMCISQKQSFRNGEITKIPVNIVQVLNS